MDLKDKKVSAPLKMFEQVGIRHGNDNEGWRKRNGVT